MKTSWRYLCKTSWRRLEDVLKALLQDVLKRLEDVLARRLENVLKTSWKRLEDVLKKYSQDDYIGLDQDVLKTYSQGEYIGLDQDVLKTSWRHLLRTKTKDVFIKTNVWWGVFLKPRIILNQNLSKLCTKVERNQANYKYHNNLKKR